MGLISLVDELTDAVETTAAALVVVTHDRQMLEDLAHCPTITFHRSAREAARPAAST